MVGRVFGAERTGIVLSPELGEWRHMERSAEEWKRKEVACAQQND
jgi:hypothetical protein